MVNTIGFDREKYIEMQSQHIRERREALGGKLYLEMGGKLFDDMHASRVLPGFTPDNKIAMLDRIKDEVEILVCINAKDLERHKIRADLGISYEEDVLRLVDVFRDRGFLVEHVVLTQLENDNRLALAFIERLQRLGIKVSRHRVIPGYPTDMDRIVSDEGFGLNEYAETTRDLVVVTAPGPGSGKLATCLSQVYHEHKRGVAAGYAKFETFPIWNLPLEHPVNLAYEAATVDLNDANVIDHFHLAAYGEQTVNYNRDVEAFPLLKTLLERLMGESPYQSPTDMGVNMAGNCISDDVACRHASEQEIIRRYFKALVEEARTGKDSTQSDRAAVVMAKAGIKALQRVVVEPARKVEERTSLPGCAIELADGSIITGATSDLLGCSSSMLLNALKHLAGIDDAIHLLSPESIEPIQTLKTVHLGSSNPRLHTDEVLIALSVSAATDSNAQKALDQLKNLRGCDVHTTTILGSVDEGIFRNLGVLVTSDPKFQKNKLYQKR
ncbi:hypothetical protein CIP107539_00083 [Corynebacterium diphtheriae]|uniref:DUF1846 domain-containing protein n=1 Tax=Corynebacterium diphtheriae TaxID=1717 RepID=UPI0013CD431B|nr:DUF1846 domain-containing protein [Corynebacterium diphtheriae]MBG9221996.1 DUF1846 domain-containing protein [Corynebacterium diphtheriae bv. mitis]MBG9294213.1 DUF1846 domain-containing protein [Corynebacterium diphtheriae bv. mitis]MBG9301464.1 DUF1846 domain-containing protein [Corynebacterium diphtheriae bv. mitis]UJL52573.1 DUF1846 domain-containing protein [Corynebacterium diphtheriae]UJL57094.1 DUF1846 domain-containing protein [Corynebacterium diphtheriae]